MTSGALLNLLIALVGGGAVAGVGAYFIARRQTSGRITTSDAATLWQQAEIMRKELRDEVERLRGDVTALKVQVGELTGEIQNLNGRLADYERRRGQP